MERRAERLAALAAEANSQDEVRAILTELAGVVAELEAQLARRDAGEAEAPDAA
jgi:hypothetical protein